MNEQLMAGKWLRHDVPKRGWRFVRLVDLQEGEPWPRRRQICQMCEARHIRWLREMRHDAWPELLRVGLECAARMEGLPLEEVRRRETALRREAARLEEWMRIGWLTMQKGEGGNIACTYKDQPPWRIELLTSGEHTCLQLRHLETEKVIISREARVAVLAKEDAYDLWHEGEALRTDYLATLAVEQRAQREAKEAARREKEAAREAEEDAEYAARLAEWNRLHPDWDANARAWSDLLEWREENTRARRLGASMTLLAVPEGDGSWHAGFRGKGDEVIFVRHDCQTAEAALDVGEVWFKTRLARRVGAKHVDAVLAKLYAEAEEAQREAAEVIALRGAWRISQKGNPYMKTGRFHVVVFKRGSRFSFSLTDLQTGECTWGPSDGFVLRQTAQAAAEASVEDADEEPRRYCPGG
jgi:hypothetical protein